MKSTLSFIFLVCFVFGFSQTYSKKEKALLSQVSKLDSLMENNDSKILELFSDDVLLDIPTVGFRIKVISKKILNQEK